MLPLSLLATPSFLAPLMIHRAKEAWADNLSGCRSTALQSSSLSLKAKRASAPFAKNSDLCSNQDHLVSKEATQERGSPAAVPGTFESSERVLLETSRAPHHVTETYCVSRNSFMPSCAPSRPRPDCFTPPKGAAGSD